MRSQTLLTNLAVLIGLAPAAVAAPPEDSVVRVITTMRLPNPARPWARQNPVEVMGTGVVIEGKRILTNAHVVLYASEVVVQGRQGGDRYDAKVETIGPDIDLATLTIDDASFFEQRPPMPRAPHRPAPNTAVAVLGFSVGGVSLAVTRGGISRIDYAPYNDRAEGLRIQVDAAVNPGSSGGPALVEGKMVGLTFGQLGQAENVGYVIPNEEIDAYLEDVKDGRYDGKPRVTDSFQTLENEALRAKLRLARTDRGIMVRRAGRSDPGYPLREGDVLTRVGDALIDNQGMIDHNDNLRLPFTALIPSLARGGTVPVDLIRDGKPLRVGLPVTRADDRLIRPYRGDYPAFFVHGPLVFSPVIDEAISFYMRGNPAAIAGSPLMTRDADRAAFPGEELVVVTAPMLAHKVVKGYSDPFGQVVADVDGVKVRNLHHLVELLRDGRGEFLTLRFCGKLAETMVFRRKAIEEATSEVMAENGIPKRGTDDVMAVWNARPTTSR